MNPVFCGKCTTILIYILAIKNIIYVISEILPFICERKLRNDCIHSSVMYTSTATTPYYSDDSSVKIPTKTMVPVISRRAQTTFDDRPDCPYASLCPRICTEQTEFLGVRLHRWKWGKITPSKSVNLRYRDNKTQHPHLHLGCVSPAMFNFFSGNYIPSAQNWISPMWIFHEGLVCVKDKGRCIKVFYQLPLLIQVTIFFFTVRAVMNFKWWLSDW